ncbi:MAG: exodeoxyribonuclease VII large subunit [Zetaproteobacteria bacterium CG12_big_fil_rev_8_21_14_0_65_55_1124]|nr:MAG: exodeoxyribonuclease VII large subunit [Zetaproteobacteria bacterium CG08_land_8_20_14_0_20_55_17]PIW41915.1 MAG: exodeoxyribonuclease VII large subunit [Zetaproteobacteria bacterium CG12_big_fil_rev_8_21_14_0_65_55_1124]PIY53532.1 MAG: exodeoxyribonuclease VII large subunit [Zetaproteobacteria bacterium CG_4_10_14_0_8_um_filter_55_43]PIZ37402.1 MAG: exodeoxyribonuclease VII large subunit [Zetaproteobacteria bacterium CG_4_10_14_0_2_um_filter_55_20]PJB81600.1 MAG: exodeoxyribonuclease V
MPSRLLPRQNAPDALSVSELTAQIKTLLEQGFSRVRVSGEVSRLTTQRAGHMYFTIKDANAALAAVIWKSTALRLSIKPEEGKQYIFHGHISLYPPQGRYQLVVSRLEEEGSGALAAEFERRKRLFAERGWFDTELKKPLPALPKHIGIVTSQTAAALQDVRKVLSTRPGWLSLTLAATPVQGQAAPVGIAQALQRLQAMQEPPDVILLVRGGGSPEDLWCFNDEIVVRNIVECSIPVITGIGHEIDTSLADFAADAHAATPSNAAEMVCPASDSLRRAMPRIGLLRQLLEHRVSKARQFMLKADAALSHRWQISRDERRMHIERTQHLLAAHSRQMQKARREQLRQLQKRLTPLEPGQRLRLRQRRLDETMQRMHHAMDRHTQVGARDLDHARQSLRLLQGKLVEQHRRNLAMQSAQLSALGPLSVLKRGYTLTMSADGQILRSVQQIKKDDALHIRFHDGTADTQVRDTHLKGNKKT